MIIYFLQILCCAAQIPGIIEGRYSSYFSGGFCLAVLFMTLIFDFEKNNKIIENMYLEQIKVKDTTIKEYQAENEKLRMLLRESKKHLCHHYCQISVSKLEKNINEALK